MTLQYRAYLVGANGMFQSAEAFEAASEQTRPSIRNRRLGVCGECLDVI